MKDIQKRRSVYKKVLDNSYERDLLKFRAKTGDYFCKNEQDLLNLINTIPNWETYLTDKQLKVTQLYIGCRNATSVDIQVGLTTGVSYHTLFGCTKDGVHVGGVLKKLKFVKHRLNEINKVRNRGL